MAQDKTLSAHNPWREFVENCKDGSNYFRSSEYDELLLFIDTLQAENARMSAHLERTGQPVTNDAVRQAFAELECELARLHPDNLPANHAAAAACYRLRLAIEGKGPTTPPKAATAEAAGKALTVEQLADLISEHLSLTWHCTRTWDAWNYGTMTQDDFQRVDESDTPTEIAQAVLELLAVGKAPASVPSDMQVLAALRSKSPHMWKHGLVRDSDGSETASWAAKEVSQMRACLAAALAAQPRSTT